MTKIQQWKGCNPLGENLIYQLLLELGGWDTEGEDRTWRVRAENWQFLVSHENYILKLGVTPHTCSKGA